MVRILKTCLFLFIILSVVWTLVSNRPLKNSFDWNASAYYPPTPACAPPCPPPDSCHHANGNPDNGCPGGNGCDGNIGGKCVEWFQDDCGEWWFMYCPNDPGGGGGGTGYPTPPITPPPGTGTVQAYAITTSSPATDFETCEKLAFAKDCIDTPTGAGCGAISGGTYLSNTLFTLDTQWTDTQVDNTGVQFSNLPSNVDHTVLASHPDNSVYLSCFKSTHTPSWTVGSGEWLYPNDTITVLVGLGPVYPWFQTSGSGSTYGDTLYSLMPIDDTIINGTPQPLFNLVSDPVSPGILSSTTGFDVSDAEGPGYLNISTTNWNTNNALTQKDWYAFFTSRLSQAVLIDYVGSEGQPNPIDAVYTTAHNIGSDKDLTISAPWNIGNEKIIVIVDGNLNINASINITGSGFIAFIVKNNIVVSPAVGTLASSSTPVVEGVYIANGTFSTGTSGVGTERFVGKGMFAANNILLERNLGNENNKTISSELFIYNPALLLISMPDILRDNPYIWQEVAP